MSEATPPVDSEETIEDSKTEDTPRRGPILSSFTTSRPVAVLMVFLAAVVFGFFSYGRLPVTLMPERTIIASCSPTILAYSSSDSPGLLTSSASG